MGLEGNETGKSDTVTEELEAGNGVTEEKHGAKDEEDVLDDTSKGEGQRASRADEENGGNVETESNTGVREKDKGAEVGDLEEGDEALGEGEDQGVDDSADGGKVVERDERVHLEALKENLDHDETRRLKGNGKDLADETRHGKVALTVRSEGNTKGDATDNHGKGTRELFEAESERDEENGNRGESLEHLDEADAEGEVGHVAENEGAREESTDGEDVLDPSLIGHLYVGKTVEEMSVPGQETGTDRGESHVEGGKEDREGEVELVGVENEPGEQKKSRKSGKSGKAAKRQSVVSKRGTSDQGRQKWLSLRNAMVVAPDEACKMQR